MKNLRLTLRYLLSKISVDYGDGTIWIQSCSSLYVILLGFGQVESRLSQTFSKKVNTCNNKGSNSGLKVPCLVPHHYAN